MLVERNECCNCATDGYPCEGNSCSQRHAQFHICDECQTDTEQLYYFEGGEYCMNCIEEILRPVVQI